MEIKIFWSALAENQLKNIFDYYYEVAGENVATRIITKITERVTILEKNPKAGQREELLKEYTEEFRYLVEGNYKIIYWINSNIVTISSVFDCQQNPEKMKHLK
jgi:plasmid stabilization system protein ParE